MLAKIFHNKNSCLQDFYYFDVQLSIMPRPISDYAERREKSKGTRRAVILNYIRYIYNMPELSLEEGEKYAAEYLQQPIEWQSATVIDYTQVLSQTKTPSTTNNYITLIRDWHKKNKIRFDEDTLDEIKRLLPRNFAVTEDEPLTVEKIRTIVSHSDPLLKAFILTACSSGARIGELLSLRYDDIEYFSEYDVYSFRLSRHQTKTGKPHRYFMSHEAMQSVNDFMRVRNQYLTSQMVKATRCLHKPTGDSEVLFVLSPQSFRLKLDNATKKAGLFSRDSESNRSRIHPHSFRKFFDTQAKEIVGINMGNELVGHDEGLSKSYRRYDLRQLSDGYKRIEPYITIQAPEDYVAIKTEIGGEVEKIQATLAIQSLELSDVKQRLEQTEVMLEIAMRHSK